MKYNADPTSCETFQYGEVEDYTVNLGTTRPLAPEAPVAIDGELSREDNVYYFNLFPNPADEMLHFTMADKRQISFRIVNYLGQEIKVGELTAGETLNVSKLPTGVYSLEVNDGQKLLNKKFIKN
jgi:hypothetical protein